MFGFFNECVGSCNVYHCPFKLDQVVDIYSQTLNLVVLVCSIQESFAWWMPAPGALIYFSTLMYILCVVVLSGAADDLHKATYIIVTAFSNSCGGPDGSPTIYIYVYLYIWLMTGHQPG